MMYFRVVLSNRDGSFTIGEDELKKLEQAIRKNTVAVFREGILVNPNMLVSVVPDKKRLNDIADMKRHGQKFEPINHFTKLLSGKMPLDLTKKGCG